MRRFAAIFLLMFFALLGASPLQAQPTPSKAPPSEASAIAIQKAIDMLATFQIPETPSAIGAPYIPKGAFSSWSIEDRQTVPANLLRGCQVIWVMFHDAPSTHFLPTAEAESDEEEFGFHVCIAGHMPKDWPDRAAHIQAVKLILSRAHKLGSTLELPAALTR